MRFVFGLLIGSAPRSLLVFSLTKRETHCISVGLKLVMQTVRALHILYCRIVACLLVASLIIFLQVNLK